MLAKREITAGARDADASVFFFFFNSFFLTNVYYGLVTAYGHHHRPHGFLSHDDGHPSIFLILLFCILLNETATNDSDNPQQSFLLFFYNLDFYFFGFTTNVYLLLD